MRPRRKGRVKQDMVEWEDVGLCSARIEVHGYLWFHTLAQPSYGYYIHRPVHVIHDMPVTLALAGYNVDPQMGYASLRGHSRHDWWASTGVEGILDELGVYAYPALPERVYLESIHFSAIGEGTVLLKATSRLGYPTRTRNTAYRPGTVLRTHVLVREDSGHPAVECLRGGGSVSLRSRLGAKRFGVIKVDFYRSPVFEAEPDAVVSEAYNSRHFPGIQGGSMILRHPAGDTGIFGRADGNAVTLLEEVSRKGIRVKRILPLPEEMIEWIL